MTHTENNITKSPIEIPVWNKNVKWKNCMNEERKMRNILSVVVSISVKRTPVYQKNTHKQGRTIKATEQ